MATMVKPKSKKKKEKKVQLTTSYPLEQDPVPVLPKVEYKSSAEKVTTTAVVTAVVVDQVPHTVVSTNIKEPSNRATSVERSIDVINDSELSTAAPLCATAPILDDDKAVAASFITAVANDHAPVLYPALSEVRQIESPCSDDVTSSMVPFGKEELREFFNMAPLAEADCFEQTFLSCELTDGHQTYDPNPLHTLLQQYANECIEMETYAEELVQQRLTLRSLYDQLWKLETVAFSDKGRCSEGHEVSASHKSQVAHFQDSILADLVNRFKSLRQLSCLHYNGLAYRKISLRIKVEEIVREAMMHPTLVNICSETPISLPVNCDRPSETRRQLRNVISTLFTFVRKGIPNKEFNLDVQLWIVKVVAKLLRVADTADHLFILHHLLRCPGGISSWGVYLIQIPKDDGIQMGSARFLHAFTVMHVILKPVRERCKFMETLSGESNRVIDADNWNVVDSDGEDCVSSNYISDLKEDDLIALLNQVPIGDIFFALSENRDGIIGFHKMMTAIAYGTMLVQLLSDGMQTYYRLKHFRHFIKRLARLIRHTVGNITDLFLIYRRQLDSDSSNRSRIQLEYDMFVLRAALRLYQTSSSDSWQYLVQFPFRILSRAAIWKLYYCMLTNDVGEGTIANVSRNFRAEVETATVRTQYQDPAISNDAMIFLLQVYITMAFDRTANDYPFIRVVAVKLLEIAYLKSANEAYQKTVKDELSIMTSFYPMLISDFLHSIASHSDNADENIVTMFMNLKIQLWLPTEDDFNLIADWLLNTAFETVKHSLARKLLTNVNYNCNRPDEPHISYELQVRIACLIVNIYQKHVPEKIGSNGVVEKQCLVAKEYRDRYVNWCWTLAGQLRLHCFDQEQNNTYAIGTSLLQRALDIEYYTPLYEGVSDEQPLAIYLALMMTSIGHSLPVICYQGFRLVQLLLNDFRYAFGIRCLELITPLFIDSVDSLCYNETFLAILTTLLAADKNYNRVSKDRSPIRSELPVSGMLRDMILAQIMPRVGLPSCERMLNLWMSCFVRLPQWQNDIKLRGIVDSFATVTYFHVETVTFMEKYFVPCFQRIEDIKGMKTSYFLQLFNQLRSTNVLANPSVEQLSTALVTLQTEHKQLELNTHIWQDLVVHIANSSNAPLEKILEEVLNQHGIAQFPACNLVVYKLARLLADCPVTHTMYPILGFRFFKLFLYRVPYATSAQAYATNVYGVAAHFAKYDDPLMKRIKRQLVNAELSYKEMALKETEETQKHFFTVLARLYKTFQLWLEDTRLNSMTSDSINLPPQFDCALLKLVFQKDASDAHYFRYTNLVDFQKDYCQSVTKWKNLAQRYDTKSSSSLNATNSGTRMTPADSASIMTSSYKEMYDQPLLAPRVSADLPQVNIDLKSKSSQDIALEWENNIRLIRQYVNDVFHSNYCHHEQLEQQLLSLAPELYTNESNFVTKVVVCPRLHSCESINVDVEYKNGRLNTLKAQNVSAVWQQFLDHIKKEQIIPQHVFLSVLLLEKLIDQLNWQLRSPNLRAGRQDRMRSLGRLLFESVIKEMNQQSISCPMACQFFTDAISKLGCFTKENPNTEAMFLLKIALRRTDLINSLSNLFVPARTTPEVFLQLYAFVIDSQFNFSNRQALFVLLSKFDIPLWLANSQPIQQDVMLLVKQILRGLEEWNLQKEKVLHDILRQHLMHLFEYKLPDYCCQILQVTMTAIPNMNIATDVLLNLINVWYIRCDLPALEPEQQYEKYGESFRSFASKQNFLSLPMLTNTATMLMEYFRLERLSFGLHGLYPKYSDYVKVISLLFGTVSHALTSIFKIASTTYLVDDAEINLWNPHCDMYEPWLVPYFTGTQQQPALWIRQLVPASKSTLLPWTENYCKTSQYMIKSFCQCVAYMVDVLPQEKMILADVVKWYSMHFLHETVPPFILNAIQLDLLKLPWHKLWPSISNLGFQYIAKPDIFQEHIFLQVDWSQWHTGFVMPLDERQRTICYGELLTFLIRQSLVPALRHQSKTANVIQLAASFSWLYLEHQRLEETWAWYVEAADPLTIVPLVRETRDVDIARLTLLKASSGIKVGSDELMNGPRYCHQLYEKHALYVRQVAMLLATGGTLPKVTGTKGAQDVYIESVQDLLRTIESAVLQLPADERDMAAEYYVNEMVTVVQRNSIEEPKLFYQGATRWMANKDSSGSIMVTYVLGSMNQFPGLYAEQYELLEVTLQKFFENRRGTWLEAARILPSETIERWNATTMQDRNCLLLLHLYYISKTKNLRRSYKVHPPLGTLLEFLNRKIDNEADPKIFLHWGMAVYYGIVSMQQSPDVFALMHRFGEHLEQRAESVDNWCDSLLGAIGMRKCSNTVQHRAVAKCMACLIFLCCCQHGSSGPATPSTDESRLLHGSHCSRYEATMGNLKDAVINKRFVEYHSRLSVVISKIENAFSLDEAARLCLYVLTTFCDEPAVLDAVQVWN